MGAWIKLRIIRMIILMALIKKERCSGAVF